MKSLSECRLYTFIDSAYLRGRAVADLARQMVDGGADVIQLRGKGLPQEQLLSWAGSIIEITSARGVYLVINDHPEVAATVSKNGPGVLCHLGQEDFFEAGFTRCDEVGPGPLGVGLSTHSPSQANRALAAGPSYIAIGPVFSTPTKPTAAPVTLEYVRWAADNVSIPWFAIGGITLTNVEQVIEAGARRICVVSAILNETDITKACLNFCKHLSSAPQSGQNK